MEDQELCAITCINDIIAGIHIRTALEENGYTGVTVKVLERYKPFLARVEGLNNIAAVEREDTKEREDAIRRIVLEM